LDLKDTADYEEIFLALLENLAETYDVDRFKVYTYAELIEEIKRKVRIEEEEEEGNIIEKIIKKVDVLSLFTKSEVIKELGRIIFS